MSIRMTLEKSQDVWKRFQQIQILSPYVYCSLRNGGKLNCDFLQAYLVNQYQGGPVPVKTRGDLKWPPAAYRKNPGDDGPTAPIATPKLPKKDYSRE